MNYLLSELLASLLDSLRDLAPIVVVIAFFQIVVFVGGLIGGFGIWMFTRRELATAQNA